MNTSKMKRGIYLLPNILTTFGLFSGFFAIILATKGQYAESAIAIFIAMLWDGLDGRVARLTNTQSEFGEQYDSCLLYTSPSPRDRTRSRMPSSA